MFPSPSATHSSIPSRRKSDNDSHHHRGSLLRHQPGVVLGNDEGAHRLRSFELGVVPQQQEGGLMKDYNSLDVLEAFLLGVAVGIFLFFLFSCYY